VLVAMTASTAAENLNQVFMQAPVGPGGRGGG
jgi:hypothetical protein